MDLNGQLARVLDAGSAQVSLAGPVCQHAAGDAEPSGVIAAAWAALSEVHDPCSVAVGCPLSLVEMQIVKSVVSTDTGLRVTLQLTEPSCIFGFHIAEEVESRLQAAVGSEIPVEVRLVHEYPTVWTEDSIMPAARARLDEFRARRALPLRPLDSGD